MNKKILIISTYPITNPQHGGQKRLDAIVREYRRKGFDARYCAIYHKPFYASCGKYDIPIPPNSAKDISNSPFTGDIVSGQVIYSDPRVKRRLSRLILDFEPDILHLEQPFTYIGLSPLLKELKISPKIIYGSQNVEYSMKEEMLTSLGYDKKYVDEKTKIIYDAEKELSKTADLVAAVSNSDLEVYKKLGAKRAVLAPNGIYRTEPSQKAIDHWRQIFNGINVQRVILYVGSAHPPNWFGFQAMVGRGLGFLRPNERIVFAGSISEYVETEIGKYSYDIGATTFNKRAFFAGRLSEDYLSGLLQFADIILLPITEGGGSNLKTAEAVVSDKKVIATSFAFRGFEELKHISNIYVADNQMDYVKSIRIALNDSYKMRDAEEEELIKTVLWPNCLKNLLSEVGKL